MHVLGKNGVTLHGMLLTPENPPHPLKSQDVINIADKQFYFLLPKDPQWWALLAATPDTSPLSSYATQVGCRGLPDVQ